MNEVSRIQPTTESVRHTPTPWRNIRSVIISDALPRDGSHHICGMTVTNNDAATAEANAAFIIEAVNSHAALTSRVEELEKALRETADYLKQQSDRLTVALSQQGWVPRRSHTEGQRNAFVSAENTLRRAALQTGGGK